MAEGFLARWARLKRDSAEPPPPAAPEPPEPPPAEALEAQVPAPPWMAALTPAGAADPGEVPPPSAEPPEPEPPLPPVEDLDAGSDYRPFLKPSVPDGLKLAALRKAWSTDPEIVAFRGFADYDWDYNAPGYGKLLPTDDIARLRDAIFGDRRPAAEPGKNGPPADAPAAAPPHEEEEETAEPALVAEAAGEPVPADAAPADAAPTVTADDRRRDIMGRA